MSKRTHSTPPRRRARLAAFLLLALLGAVALVIVDSKRRGAGGPGDATARPPRSATFVGGQACAPCHQREYEAWRRSHHALAMQQANEKTVLGDFANARLSYAGVTSVFSRRDGRFVVTTDGPDGRLRDFPIAYAFGVAPLQQYLVELPGGRLQALPIAWDTRPGHLGGQRWFHLYPNESIDHRDPLHWTRPDQNWNWMCAECHSTGVRRNYDLATDSYQTQWAELNVSCEACHGPGSLHVEWAAAAGGRADRTMTAAAGTREADIGLTVRLDERRGVTWRVDPVTGQPVRGTPLATRREVETCALCHARRAPVAGRMAHAGRLMDSHNPSLLDEGLYFADGQQQDEVYTYAPFLQSRMFAHGVTCSDCHEPHGATLRYPGNAVCLQCHASPRYSVASHTLHREGSEGASCAACHMPTRTYMGVDDRHDHSIRVPRPDLSDEYGVPNACNGCHVDRTARWAASTIARRFGPRPTEVPLLVAALHAARTGAPGASGKLVALATDPSAPAIARATALAGLRSFPGALALAAIESGLRASEALMRAAAAGALKALPPTDRLRLGEPLLEDEVKVVRLETASALAPVPLEGLAPERRARLEAAFAEYVEAQRASAERPESHMNLAGFYRERGNASQAEAEYRTALRLQPWFVPASLNLADLYRELGREVDAEATLVAGLQQVPGDGDLTHALALLRVRQGRRGEALDLFQHAAERRPRNPRYFYVYAVALVDAGGLEEGLDVVESALARFPNDIELLYAAALYAHDAGRAAQAARHARQFIRVAPGDPRVDALQRRELLP